MFTSGTLASGNRDEPYRSIIELAPLLYFRLNDTNTTALNIGSVAGNGTSTSVTTGSTPVPSRSVATSSTFNGTSSFITRTDGVLTGATPTFSCGFWIVVTAAPTVTATLFQMKDTTNNASGLAIKLNNAGSLTITGVTTAPANDFSFTVNIGGATTNYLDDNSSVITPKVLLDGTPHLIGITATATQILTYIDGQLFQTTTRVGGTWSDTGDTFIGRTNTAAEYFNGRISDVFVTATQLTYEQWFKLYRNGMVNAVSPVGDNWNDAPLISLGSTVTLTMLNSRREPDEPTALFGRLNKFSSWAKIVPPTTGSYEIAVISAYKSGVPLVSTHYWAPVSPVIVLATGSTLAGLSNVSSTKTGTNFVRYTLTGGTTYYVGYTTDPTRAYYFDYAMVQFRTETAPPFNDTFANAITLNVSVAGTYTGSNYAATDEVGETSVLGAGTWFKFTPSISGNITFDTQLTPTVDTDILVVTGATVGATSTVGTDSGSGTNETATLTVAVTSGVEYHVRVGDQYNGVSSYILRWTAVA